MRSEARPASGSRSVPTGRPPSAAMTEQATVATDSRRLDVRALVRPRGHPPAKGSRPLTALTQESVREIRGTGEAERECDLLDRKVRLGQQCPCAAQPGLLDKGMHRLPGGLAKTASEMPFAQADQARQMSNGDPLIEMSIDIVGQTAKLRLEKAGGALPILALDFQIAHEFDHYGRADPFEQKVG